MFFLYQVCISIIILFSPIIILFRIFKNKEDKKRFTEKFSFFSKKRAKGKLIWFHGASVGEVLSVIPVIKKYEKDKSINQILITSSTLSSSKVLLKFKFKKTIHQFYPVDHYFFTDKFLKYWRPDIAIFIDSEIWPCMFKTLDSFKIPLILLNARITKKTFIRWMKIKKFSEFIFNKISIAYPQNLETKKFLEKLKVKKINVIGNLKYAETDSENQDIISHQLKSQFKNKKIWIASSTHANEEVFCAKAHIELKKKCKNLITIIIPRHVHRAKKIVPEIKNLKLEVIRHSSKNINLKDTDIYLVDTFGETKKFHKIGHSVFLGGSIVKRGGQNPLEAARYGAKILHGPNIHNFKDVYKLLKSLKISKVINSSKKLASSINFNPNKANGNKIKKIGRIILKKTICIGNIYIGGTGKTSLSIKINEILNSNNMKSCFIKKFYKSQLDEKMLLEKRGKVFSSLKRIDAINQAVDEEFDVAILDDGLQDQTLKCDINFVCFNSQNWIGNGLTIPAGPLRENIKNLKNYQHIFINGNNDDLSEIKKDILEINSNINIHVGIYQPLNMHEFNKNDQYLVFSGIGNHRTFISMIKRNGLNISKDIEFPDHYKYMNTDIEQILNQAHALNSKIITTEKDYLRLEDNKPKEIKFIKSTLKIIDEKKLINTIIKINETN